MFLLAGSESLHYDVTMLKVDWTFLGFSKCIVHSLAPTAQSSIKSVTFHFYDSTISVEPPADAASATVISVELPLRVTNFRFTFINFDSLPETVIPVKFPSAN